MRTLISVCLLLAVASVSSAQSLDDFNEFKRKQQKSFQSYKDKKKSEFEEYRLKRNQEYAEFMRQAWERMGLTPEIPRPEEDEVQPVVIPESEPIPDVPEPTPKPFEEVLDVPAPQPQPEPVVPIEEVPAPVNAPTVSFSYCGTTMSVRFDKANLIKLSKVSGNSVADAWNKMSGEKYTNLVYDCLALRSDRLLCDWAYLMMLRQMSTQLYGSWCNEAKLLTAYIYCQSGYRVRLASANGSLYPLVASEHIIYGRQYFQNGGNNFYPIDDDCPAALEICNQAFEKEKSLSLWITDEPMFADSPAASREHRSEKYPSLSVTVHANRNLLDFYESYPTSMVGDDICTRWAMYANTPMSKGMREQLYPALKSAIEGKTAIEAANILLNWVQTGFEYEYDDKVWGHDRAFFSEETLNYPYCDCEDRSILFTRLVRDLLGLKCILVYYPGHLASGVCFNESVDGDYINLNGSHYTITDPTYIRASVGMTMPKMENASAKVILLK